MTRIAGQMYETARLGRGWKTQHAARSRFRAGQVSLECVPLAVLPDNSVTGAYGT
jgi:hypothetical protein